MVHDLSISLPEIFPTGGDIEVEEEPHEYRANEGDGGDLLEEREYVIDKAPISSIIEVTGTLGGRQHEFIKGTDYELSTDKERIVWLDDPADRPDPDTEFYISYRSQSILSRYIQSGEEELEIVDEALEDIITSRFVDSATGEDLDRLGELFGELGRRRGRTDTQYRIYLKSVVQSFISRGTKNGIKLAISAATDVPVEDITINENFYANEYEVVVVANTPVTASVLEDISDIADPSGVSQVLTRFTIDVDVLGVNDVVLLDDNTTETFEDIRADEDIFIDRNSIVNSDAVGQTDETFVDLNKFLIEDEFSSNDAATTSQTIVEWDAGDWDSMNWAVEHN